MRDMRNCSNGDVEEVVAYTSIFNSAFSKSEEAQMAVVKMEEERLLEDSQHVSSKTMFNKTENELGSAVYVPNESRSPKQVEWFRLHVGINKVGEYGEKNDDGKRHEMGRISAPLNTYHLRRHTSVDTKKQRSRNNTHNNAHLTRHKSNNGNSLLKKGKEHEANHHYKTCCVSENKYTLIDMEKKKENEALAHKKSSGKMYMNGSDHISEQSDKITESEELSQIRAPRTRRKTYVYVDESSDKTVDDDEVDSISVSSSFALSSSVYSGFYYDASNEKMATENQDDNSNVKTANGKKRKIETSEMKITAKKKNKPYMDTEKEMIMNMSMNMSMNKTLNTDLNEFDEQESLDEHEIKRTHGMKRTNGCTKMKMNSNYSRARLVECKKADESDGVIDNLEYTHTGPSEDKAYLFSFKAMFSKKNKGINRYNPNYIHIPNVNSEKYINRILRNVMNRRTSVLNTVSKNFERIESFYKGDFFVFIENEEDEDCTLDKNFFKIENSVFLCDAYQENGYNTFRWGLKNEIENENQNQNQNKKQSERTWGKEKEKEKEEKERTRLKDKNEKDEHDNEDEDEEYEDEDEDDEGNSDNETSCLNNLWGFFNTCFVDEAKKFTKQNKNRAVSPVTKSSNNIVDFLNKSTLFYAVNKKNDIRKRIKEGDRLYIKFNNVYDEYDNLNILKKETVVQLLIYMMKNNLNLRLTEISKYSPAFFWNIALHFNQNRVNVEQYLEKIFSHVYYGEQPNREGDKSNVQKNRSNDIGRTREKKNKNSTAPPLEILQKKDSVVFLSRFLQSVNDRKKKRLYWAKREFDEKHRNKRNLNKLSKAELINAFIDKEAEVNIYPLSTLKESNRIYIYEENVKQQMFACIKIIYDDIKGRCVCAASDIGKYDFICEYVGELIHWTEARRREEMYMKDNKKESYMYYFRSDEKTYCIDSTAEYMDALEQTSDKIRCLRSFARLVNHSRKNANLIAKVIKVDNEPRLIFIASRNIKEGEELLVDYGERDKDVIKENEWLKC